MNAFKTLGMVMLALLLSGPVLAQQKLGYIDSEYILGKLPEYATVQQQVDRQAQEWQQEIEARQREVDELFQAYQARELLFTNEERQRKQQEIVQAEDEVERLRMQYFGPEGQLFQEQENLMRPIQEQVVTALEEVAEQDGYDFVFDKAGDYLFLFARDQHDLSDRVLEELGIDIEQSASGGRGGR